MQLEFADMPVGRSTLKVSRSAPRVSEPLSAVMDLVVWVTEMANKLERSIGERNDPVVSKAAPFEFVVLMSVRHLTDKAYGAEIWRNVSYRLGREPSIGQVYVALKRLEDKDCVKSFVAPPTPVKGGRSKRVFQITEKGMKVLEESAASFTALGSLQKELDSELPPQGTSVAR